MDLVDLHKRAESGSCVARTILGICYLDGIDTEVDYQNAFPLLSSAAEMGASRAIFHLGRMYGGGLGVAKNLAAALRLYEDSAARGEFTAQIELGRIYSRGLGVAVDPAKAKNWYLAAIDQAASIAPNDPDLEGARAYIEGRLPQG